MEKTVIYVFIPKRLRDDYVGDKVLPNNPTGWVKIGKTYTQNENDDKWEVAFKRVSDVSHTGISEICVLVDVFEYPKLQGNPDDVIRRIMAEDVYNLPTSRQQNKQVDSSSYEIKAGREYVYGTSKKQIYAAIAKFERDLLITENNPSKLKKLLDYIKRNHETSIEDSLENSSNNCSKIKIYDNIVNELSNHGIKATHPNNKNYGYMHAEREYIDTYSFSYSFKKCQATIAIETIGENNASKIEEYIEQYGIRNYIPIHGPLQGIKNKRKYSWKLFQFFDDTNEKAINDWFVHNLKKIQDLFENDSNHCVKEGNDVDGESLVPFIPEDKHYMCPICGQVCIDSICPKCNSECNLILY